MLHYLLFAPSKASDCMTDLPATLLLLLHRFSHSRLMRPLCVPTVLLLRSTGISTCCPSTTLFSLALGPDLPRVDELDPGTLSQSVGRILTFLTLLTPAFSLPSAPVVLTIYLQRPWNAPLPCWKTNIHSFGVMLKPRYMFCAEPLD